MEKDNGYEPAKETDTKYPRRLPSKRKSEILKLRIGNNTIVMGYDGIKRASSIVSLIFRFAGKEYINRNDYSDEEGEL